MKLEQKNFCPLIKKDCLQMGCSWFIQVRGKHPQTGQEVDEWGCSITWLPVLLVEGAQQTRQAGAAIESFRNEMVNSNQQTLTALIERNDIKKLR